MDTCIESTGCSGSCADVQRCIYCVAAVAVHRRAAFVF